MIVLTDACTQLHSADVDTGVLSVRHSLHDNFEGRRSFAFWVTIAHIAGNNLKTPHNFAQLSDLILCQLSSHFFVWLRSKTGAQNNVLGECYGSDEAASLPFQD
jgi:hypothetical protein